ncbi:DUF3244 domain-containing protein [Bacteroides ihuae]|uniref:DUF3244 domain-containing protein n=1 Tax=Bacteroides ihuae TaxID=1852362 RepID=UPI0008D9DE9F|nr:DUF3244 domain-containing protein [Bacteroides ihuae]
MKIKSFILFLFLIFPCINVFSKPEPQVEYTLRHHKKIRWTQEGVLTRAPGLILTGYLEDQSLFLSFSQPFNDVRIVIIDAATGNVVYDSRITGNSLIVPSIDEDSPAFYIQIASGSMKMTGEIRFE